MGSATREFDTAGIFEKYRQERDKRLRPDGTAQYIKAAGQFERYRSDPYSPVVERAPIERDVEVAILGGGFGGLLAAARLRSAGVEDIWILEKGGDFGGAWYWNRYPGVACDTESYVYMPLLEETGAVPSMKYAPGPEIRAHAQLIGRRFGLYEHALFHTEITGAEWDEQRARWALTTDRGDVLSARFFMMASGSYPEPKLPGIPGIESYRGHSFHTSRWDYEYTGGDPSGNLTDLYDKRVGIIGTGATAVQAVPHLGRWAKHLYVFQRTPSSVDVRANRLTEPTFADSLAPGWQHRRIINFTSLLEGYPVDEDMVDDGWTKLMRSTVSARTAAMSPREVVELMQLADLRAMEGIRARVDAVVRDSATAEALKPWYNRKCKRPCFHDEYLSTFNRANVTLVDTAGRGVERITEDAVVFDGAAYEIDCLIFATGFELGAFTRADAFPIRGRDGITLKEKWKNGATTLHGIHIHGFPNFFMLSTTQSPWGANFLHMLDEQAKHVAYIVSELDARFAQIVEVTKDAEAAWVATHMDASDVIARTWRDCTPSYFNNEGNLTDAILRDGSFGGGVITMVRILDEWRATGELPGLGIGAVPALSQTN